ncbi:hypothetical protein [uncultured Ramlibacter sp.]|uniref:hypothetical protein n=1 Tax=uncultured Ramlibacter sp. TaxID=260755 RepID=UPI00260ACF0B|nr:hypothetical protein [uncultured Ramlibacter sp.]
MHSWSATAQSSLPRCLACYGCIIAAGGIVGENLLESDPDYGGRGSTPSEALAAAVAKHLEIWVPRFQCAYSASLNGTSSPMQGMNATVYGVFESRTLYNNDKSCGITQTLDHVPPDDLWYGFAVQGVVCLNEATSSKIELVGPSATTALPAGPALPYRVRVTENGSPIAGRQVTISVDSGGAINGTTNAAGEFGFMYVPPLLRKTVEQLSATCAGCGNTAKKQINVEACDICEAKR